MSRQQGPADPIVEPDEGGNGAGGRRKRWSRVALWCALAGVTVAVVAVVALREPARSPAEELGRIREFVASAGTGRFEGTSRSEWGEGPEKPGSTSIDVSRLEGSFHLPGRMRFLEDDGDFLYESIVVDDAAYSRSADSRAELEAEPWTYEAVPGEGPRSSVAILGEGIDEESAAALSTASDVLGAFGTPFDPSELLGRLGGVRWVSSGVLEASVTARDLFPPEVVEAIERDSAEEEIDTAFLDDPVVIRLVHADDGQLDEMVITAESHDGEERTVDRTTLRFSGWGQPVQIAAPSRGEVDVTPGVDEEDLAAFREFPLLAPKSPPAGMVLESAYVQEEDPEIESCPSVDLAYGTESPPGPDAEVASFLRLSLVDRSCPSSDEEAAFFGSAVPAETVRIGPYEAQLRRLPAPPRDAGPPLLDVRLTTDRVVVDAQTNLPQDQAVAALASMGPLDLASQPVARSEPPPG